MIELIIILVFISNCYDFLILHNHLSFAIDILCSMCVLLIVC